MTASGAPEVVTLLRSGDIEVLGVLPYASNYTYLTRVGGGDEETLAVYKPRRGERPLWDFPSGSLAAREVAAYLVSDRGGFGLVPPTVLRDDGPFAGGSLQLFVEHDPERHYFVLAEERLADFALVAAFDVVINNADRKAGHILEDRAGRLWGVDHGVTFHVEPKLRTVVWEFAGSPIPAPVAALLEGLGPMLEGGGSLASELAGLLTEEEIAATRRRAAALLGSGRFPPPPDHYPLPWPLV